MSLTTIPPATSEREHELVVGTWNLLGGQGNHDPVRLNRQLDVITRWTTRYKVDLWALQECSQWADENNHLRNDIAARLGMDGFLIPSAHFGCHLVMLVRRRGGLRVVGERHDRAQPWFHALGHLKLEFNGHALRFLNVHLAPSSPSLRKIEAEVLGLWRNDLVIAAGDFNAVPATGDLPDISTLHDADKAHRKLDRAAARTLHNSGYRNVAACMGDTSPTVGFYKTGSLAYQCDRIETTLPRPAFTDFAVIPIDEPPFIGPTGDFLSDHRPALATFTLTEETLTTPAGGR